MYITLHKIIKLKIQEYPHKFDHWLRDILRKRIFHFKTGAAVKNLCILFFLH